MRILSGLLLAAWLIARGPAFSPAPAPESSSIECGERAYGGRYFFCAMSQVVKYYGLFTANPGFVLAGALGGGLACAFGW